MTSQNVKIATPVPDRMHAVLLTGHGGLDKLVYRTDVPVPVPGAHDVLVRVLACAVNNTDLNTRVGWYGAAVSTGFTEAIANQGIPLSAEAAASWDRESVAFPRIQGAAIAGEIAALGSAVRTRRIGERVVVDPVIRDMSMRQWARAIEYVGSERDGGYAQYVLVPESNALLAPDGISADKLACLPCAYQTAEEMQIRVDVEAGDRVLVTGASGGVGLANVQLAKLRGAHVTAIAAADKVDAVRAHGADVVLERDRPTFVDDLQRAIGHRGTDVVMDVVGGPITDTLWQLLARAGRYVTAGAIAGPRTEVDLRALIYKDVRMYGVTFPEAPAMANLLRYVSDRSLDPVVDKTFGLHELPSAQAEFAKRRHVGKIVIHIPG